MSDKVYPNIEAVVSQYDGGEHERSFFDLLIEHYGRGETRINESPVSAEAIAGEIVGRYRNVALATITGRPQTGALLKHYGEGSSYDGPLYVRILAAMRDTWNGDRSDAARVVKWLCRELHVSTDETLPPIADTEAMMTAMLRREQHRLFGIPGPLYNDINRALDAARRRKALNSRK